MSRLIRMDQTGHTTLAQQPHDGTTHHSNTPTGTGHQNRTILGHSFTSLP